MKIAVTYDNGEIFQHFGRTEFFKIYEVDNGEITDTKVIDSEGQGHGALAGVLYDNGIDVLICGGMGSGARIALEEVGIEVVAGVEGDADKAVSGYLNGELESTGANCNHHDENHECGGCGSHEEGGCQSGCGGCGSRKPAFDGKNVGKKVRAHYQGTFNDGTQFDSSYDRGEPLEFVCGAGMMILGFDKAVANMNVGDVVNVHLMPNEAYGESDPAAIFTVDIANMQGSEELEVGQRVYLTNMMGQPFPVSVVAKDETTITFDANHEMAGKELNFKIELVEVLE